MAKVIDMFPENGNGEELGAIQNFKTLLRAVVDGDKEAIEELRSQLDMWDKIDILENSDDEGEDNDDWSGEEGDADPTRLNAQMTLPRENVKELHLRIKLNDTDLKIWREVKVPSNISLEGLAKVLIDVMGWEHEHLYQFEINKEFYELRMKDDIFASFSRAIKHDITQYTLSDVLSEKGKRIRFDYDFGDSWEHDVWIKGEREYADGEKPVIMCVKGQGACPPEDCGGVWGYADLLELRSKKRLTADEKDRLDWYGMLEDFDPDYFDKEDADDCLGYWSDKI